MDRLFQRVFTRARSLGTPARKHILTIEREGERLLDRLDRTSSLSRVHIDRTSSSLASDFDHVAAAGADRRESLVLLGAFHAVQWLHLNARSLERLAFDLAEGEDRRTAFRRFLHRAEEEHFHLTSTYVRRLLRILVPPALRSSYVLCIVGTRSHQDDVDIAVAIDRESNRDALDRAFSRLADQLLRYGSPIDNYVASQLGARGFCLTIEEMSAALRSHRMNFVVVTELLAAERVAGSPALLERMRRNVTERFYHGRESEDPSHELFLRGLLGETRSLLLRPPDPNELHTKNQGLRIIRSLTTALATITGIPCSRVGETLAGLESKRPALREELRRLSRSRVFLETFHILSQSFISWEESVELQGEAAQENLRAVAAAMGYRDRGPLQANDHLLVHYHEAVEETHSAAQAVMADVANHLAGVSRFAVWSEIRPNDPAALDLAREFVLGVRAFRGARFWDDVLGALAAPHSSFLDAFVRSFLALPDERRRRLARRLADWGRQVPYSLMTIIVLLDRRGGEAKRAGREIVDAFLRRLGGRPEDIRALARVFRFYPDLMNRFLLCLGPETLTRFRDALDVAIGDHEVAVARDRLGALVAVHRETSSYVKRVLARLTARHSAAVLALTRDATMRTLALGRLAAGERHPKFAERKGLLGDYYDLEFLRVAMGTLRGRPQSETRAAFRELTRTYVTGLVDVCLREAEIETGGRAIFDRDRLGIYMTGGNARGRPYDEDYDLIALLDAPGSVERDVAERAVILMNREIARRGVIAQYRFGDRFGRFVTTVDEVDSLFAADEDDDLFVDRCQILGARQIVGGRRLEAAFSERILKPHVFAKAAPFLDRIRAEILDRRRIEQEPAPGTMHLKKMPGGLRELDLCLMAGMARFGVHGRSDGEAIRALIRLDPGRGSLYESLREAASFLVALRSVYRVVVVASDVVERDWLEPVARVFGYSAGGDEDPRDALFGKLREVADRAAAGVDRIVEEGGLIPS